jgi:hypothetical protein
LIPADELERRLWEIWEHTRALGLTHGTTYGVDQVGKCIDLVRNWPEGDPE